jgi:hypothetical protein
MDSSQALKRRTLRRTMGRHRTMALATGRVPVRLAAMAEVVAFALVSQAAQGR